MCSKKMAFGARTVRFQAPPSLAGPMAAISSSEEIGSICGLLRGVPEESEVEAQLCIRPLLSRDV